MEAGKDQQAQHRVNEISSAEFAELCKLAAKNREDVPTFACAIMPHSETGRLCKGYLNGHIKRLLISSLPIGLYK
ncbi:hypothetical protein [Oscillibacter sp.]|uniref:hypothetical protein n=1 Tax=Oscillibacter sp. TaxID=1945593 RepID=UPI0028A054E4|nr:hypothetical protein [Oscillibacter sp.]